MLLLGALAGCTRHNGDIGPLFGTWRLDGLERTGADGAAEEMPIEFYSWAFQSNILRITKIMDHHDFEISVGTWSLDEDVMTLNFTHSENNPDNIDYFRPPAELHLSSTGVTRLRVQRLDRKRLVMDYTDAEGDTYTYILNKSY